MDCLNLVIKAEETLRTHQIQPLPGFGYPLTVLLGALFIMMTKLFGLKDPVFAVNFMSVTFSSFSVPVFYLFVKKLCDQKTALFSAILFSLYPFFLGESLSGMSHAPCIFFLLAGLLLMSIYKNTSRRLHLILSGLCLGLMGAVRLQDLILMLIPISFFFLFAGGQTVKGLKMPALLKLKFKNFLLFIAIVSGVTISFHLPLIFNQNYQATSAISWFWQAGLTSNFMGFLSPHLEVSLFMITFSISPGGILMALAGLALLAKKNISTFIFLVLWFLIPLMFYGNLYTTTSRFLVIAALPLIIAEGYTLSYLISAPRWFFKAGAIISFWLIIWVTFREVYPIFKFRHLNAPLVEFSRWIASVTEPNAIIIAADDGFFIEHYAKREAVHNPCGIYEVNKTALPEFKTWLDKELESGHPVYITYGGLRSGDRTNEFLDFIFDHYTLLQSGQHLSEDWHQGSTKLNIGQDYLYRISAF